MIESKIEPSINGDIINMTLLLIAIIIVFVFQNNYMDLQETFDNERSKVISSLQDQNEEYKTFNRSIAHDLKEPLRSISGFSNLIYRKLEKKQIEECSDFQEQIDGGIERMSTLIEDLLQYIEASDKQAMTTDVDLNQIVKGSVENLSQRINERKAKIDSEQLPVVKMNKSYAIMLFQNLIGNAIKFTPNNRIPEIKVTHKKTAEKIEIEVHDNGIGIQQTDLETVFEPFNRLNGHKIEGSGLGLALCRKVMQSVGGDIAVNSIPGEGSAFTLIFPSDVVLN